MQLCQSITDLFWATRRARSHASSDFDMHPPLETSIDVSKIFKIFSLTRDKTFELFLQDEHSCDSSLFHFNCFQFFFSPTIQYVESRKSQPVLKIEKLGSFRFTEFNLYLQIQSSLNLFSCSCFVNVHGINE